MIYFGFYNFGVRFENWYFYKFLGYVKVVGLEIIFWDFFMLEVLENRDVEKWVWFF